MKLKILFLFLAFLQLIEGEASNVFNFYTNTSYGNIIGNNNNLYQNTKKTTHEDEINLKSSINNDNNKNGENENNLSKEDYGRFGNRIHQLNNNGTLNIVSGHQRNYYYLYNKNLKNEENFPSEIKKEKRHSREETTISSKLHNDHTENSAETMTIINDETSSQSPKKRQEYEAEQWPII